MTKPIGDREPRGIVKKPRIAVVQFYFYPDISAVSQLLGDLLSALTKKKLFDLTVFCGTSTSVKEKSNRLPGNKIAGVRIRRISTPNLGKASILTRLIDYISYYLFIFLYFSFSRKWDAIVCMTSPPLIGFMVVLAALIRRIPIIYYIQDLYPEILFDLGYIKKPWLVRKLMAINRIIIRNARRVITIGEYMEKKLRSSYKCSKAKTITLHNWADNRTLQWKQKAESDGFLLIYSGNMGLAHDFTYLPELLYRLKGTDGIAYQFIGGGKKRSELLRIFKNTRERRVNFSGYARREDVERNLMKADMLVIAQKEETIGDILPSKFFSYLAVGKPILFFGPKESEIGEAILGNDIGTVIESQWDIDMAVRYIMQLKRYPSLARSIGKRAHRLYSDHYQFRYSFQAFERLLSEVLESSL